MCYAAIPHLLPIKRYLIIILACMHLVPSTSFNIDERYPIIIQNKGQNGRPNYFGATVSFLKSDEGNSWVLIGAPKANSTLAAHVDIVEPGVIWQCSLGHSVEKCRPIVMDPSGSSDDNRKDAMDLGGSELVLSDKKLFACSKTWDKRQVNENISLILMDGTCYSRQRTDLFNDDLQTNPLDNRTLTPLANAYSRKSKTWRTGLAGFSIHLPKFGNEIVMGAPGAAYFNGTVIQYLSKDGGNSFKDPYIYRPFYPNTPTPDLISNNNYLGYSITSGTFYSSSAIQYVAGAPRGNDLTGKVVIFRFPVSDTDSFTILHEINGPQIGSYFGATVLAVDVNGDSYDDLLVSAPRYSRNTKGSQPRIARGGPTLLLSSSFTKYGAYGDEGAVFVYLHKNSKLSLEPQKLVGKFTVRSQFGTAIASLGDIDRDEFNDVAISAPYGANGGAVYIYRGSKSGLVEDPQIIFASKIDSNLKGFGYSLGGNQDIDNNGFNDLVIGSYNSSQVVVLRSRPVVTVSGFINPTIKMLSWTVEAFEIESCVSYTGDGAPTSVELEIKLSSDWRIRPARVKIFPKESSLENAKDILYYKVLAYKGTDTCKKFIARVVEAINKHGDAVDFKQEISISKTDESELQKSIMEMNIERNGALTVHGKFNSFCKTCPVLNAIKPREFAHQLPLDADCGDDNRCLANLELNVSFNNITDQGFLIGSSTSLIMDIHLHNSEETAVLPKVMIEWQKLNLKRIPTNCTIDSNSRTKYAECNLGNALEKNQDATTSLEFDMSDFVIDSFTDKAILFYAIASTKSDMTVYPVQKNVTIPLYASASMFIEGSKLFDFFNPSTLSTFLILRHQFEIGLDGVSTVGNFQAEFSIPVNLTTSNGTVISVRGHNTAQNVFCQPTVGHYSTTESGVIDTDTEIEDVGVLESGIGGILTEDRDRKRKSNNTLVEKDVLFLHCNSPFVSCMKVECTISDFKPGTTASITFIMDIKSTVIRSLLKTHQVSKIKVESKGTLILPDAVKTIQSVSTRPVETIAITLIEEEGYQNVQKWVYVLAVVIGIVVFACLFLCLYSCGCVANNKKPDQDEVDGVTEPLNKTEKDDNNEIANDENESSNKVRNTLMSDGSIDVHTPPSSIPPTPNANRILTPE